MASEGSRATLGVRRGMLPKHLITGTKAEWEHIRAQHLKTFADQPFETEKSPCEKYTYTKAEVFDAIDHCRSIPCPCGKLKCWILVILLNNEVQ